MTNVEVFKIGTRDKLDNNLNSWVHVIRKEGLENSRDVKSKRPREEAKNNPFKSLYRWMEKQVTQRNEHWEGISKQIVRKIK